jgi:hypothetical protein
MNHAPQGMGFRCLGMANKSDATSPYQNARQQLARHTAQQFVVLRVKAALVGAVAGPAGRMHHAQPAPGPSLRGIAGARLGMCFTAVLTRAGARPRHFAGTVSIVPGRSTGICCFPLYYTPLSKHSILQRQWHTGSPEASWRNACGRTEASAVAE